MMDNPILQIASFFISLILAITIHEASHGYTAKYFGDPTAKIMGRLTLNPAAHVDLFGTLLLPAFLFFSHAPFLFGYAKPVPVDPRNLSPRRLGEFMVAFSGLASNFLLAILAALLLHLNPGAPTFGNDILHSSIQINVVLAIFNLIPLLPLDGGRMLQAALPKPLALEYEKIAPYGSLLILGLSFIPVYQGRSSLTLILTPCYNFIIQGILILTGHI